MIYFIKVKKQEFNGYIVIMKKYGLEDETEPNIEIKMFKSITRESHDRKSRMWVTLFRSVQ